MGLAFTSRVLAGTFSVGVAMAADSVALDGSWRAITVNGVAVSGPTLVVAGTRASGTGGCNNYGGEVVVAGRSLKFQKMMSTLMACDDTKMKLEGAYHAALRDVVQFELLDGQLELKNAAGVSILTFRK
jgi:heat shock protein HslJ